jgi:hypothetical protein
MIKDWRKPVGVEPTCSTKAKQVTLSEIAGSAIRGEDPAKVVRKTVAAPHGPTVDRLIADIRAYREVAR